MPIKKNSTCPCRFCPRRLVRNVKTWITTLGRKLEGVLLMTLIPFEAIIRLLAAVRRWWKHLRVTERAEIIARTLVIVLVIAAVFAEHLPGLFLK